MLINENYALLGIGFKRWLNNTDRFKYNWSEQPQQTILVQRKTFKNPKSITLATAAIHMNPKMKGNIVAKLDKIHKGIKDTYLLKFYKSLSWITNALDNIQAQRFLDGQAVRARIPLIDSGTLEPKGHVHVVLPNMTETYSSTNDPKNIRKIPYCTLKML